MEGLDEADDFLETEFGGEGWVGLDEVECVVKGLLIGLHFAAGEGGNLCGESGCAEPTALVLSVGDEEFVVGAPEGVADVCGEGGLVEDDGVADNPGGDDEGECEEVGGGGFEDWGDGLFVSMREIGEVG